MVNKTAAQVKDEAIRHMREAFPVGARMHVLVTNRDSSGANVRIFAAGDYGDGIHITDVTHRIADAIGKRHGRRGIRFSGQGLSPVTQVVDWVGYALHGGAGSLRGVEL